MGRPAAVWLVDLEARDRDGSGLLGQVHSELAEEAVGPDRRLVDRDHALHVGPGSIDQNPLREEVAGRIPADVAGIRGQVEELVIATEDDLDLLDRAPITIEPIVDPAADEPAPELGQCPAEVRTRPDRGLAVLQHDLRRAEVLDACDPQLRIGREIDLECAREQ